MIGTCGTCGEPIEAVDVEQKEATYLIGIQGERRIVCPPRCIAKPCGHDGEITFQTPTYTRWPAR